MKTNFTMTKRLLFAISLLAVIATSCSEDEVIPPPDIAGIYNFTSATLIDGDIADATTTDLVIENGGGPGVTYTGKAGDIEGPSFWVNAVLSGLAPCTDQNPANWRYQINLKSDGGLAFICNSENDLTVDNGTWELTDDNKTVVLTIESPALGTVVVKIEEATLVTGGSGVISGTMNTFPMLKNAGVPIGEALPGGGVNLQFIAFNLVLSK